MEGRDLSREPCPDRIVEDMGGAFGMGSIGGFLWNFGKGLYNAPRGVMFQNALYAASSRAPVLGGNFAVWGGTFSSFDCTFQAIRKKEDHWNAIASGFATGGVLAMRGGLRHASRNALIGGLLLSIIEAVSVIIGTRFGDTPRHQFQKQLQDQKALKNTNDNNAMPINTNPT
ncbi:mitochondrial import inner membrane translocase subunit tim17, putative [Theileria equi strain WA]|uniref:Mitochondrial import inner membrane translocase subunit tim17, putative n=1 Tax=Theileria equi strain WA TaxID=1537102 RepID=L1LFQ6_THEEQ|nr:mitochondrial import inner membrane translocase subunit tim17, putative [Theileria equi strain WA]EKX74095.1 mitochondrial import inner membrane translocase subunit tim17, putative [Theileria equi strain WA]|eukprot:XP_004833547.1 mitochondrial import inner membrane translocase subunit tim17, putative [Theileria equi strain WA]